MRRTAIPMAAMLLATGCRPDARSAVPSCDVPRAIDLDPAADVVEVELVADEHVWDPGTGKKIRGFAYNGQVPGPLIEVKPGDRLKVHFRNAMDEHATTIHWHGLRVPDTMDGVPAIQDPVQPGETFEYEFVVPDAGFYWYHPHMDSDQVLDRGLYGLLLVRDPAEPKLDCDVPLALDDAELDAEGQILLSTNSMERHMGHLGNALFANGRVDRRIPIAPGGHALLRLVNAANARYFDLALEDHTFEVVATDVGWLEASYEVNRLVMGPGERYTVLVKGTGEPGREYRMVNYREVIHTEMMSEKDPLGAGPTPVLTLVYGNQPVVEPAPAFPTGNLPDFTAGAAAHQWHVEESMAGGQMVMTIDGETWPDVTPTVLPGNVFTTLQIRNDGMGRHPMHLHGQRFQVLSLDGVPAARRAWKDTVDVPAGSTMTIGTMLDNPGRWMFHCHILEHGEDGMMTMLVVEP